MMFYKYLGSAWLLAVLVVNRLVIFVSEITGKQRTKRLLRNNSSAPKGFAMETISLMTKISYS